MPRRYVPTRRAYRRRTFAVRRARVVRRRAVRRPLGRIPRGVRRDYSSMPGVPPTKTLTLTYSKNIAMSSNNNIPTFHYLRANSPYDPEFVTGSGQETVYGWDFWSGQYRQYMCRTSVIYLEAAPFSVRDGAPASEQSRNTSMPRLGLDLTRDVETATVQASMNFARPGMQHKTLSLDKSTRFMRRYSGKALYPFAAAAEHIGTSSSNPFVQALYRITLTQGFIDALDTIKTDVNVFVTIKYRITFFDPIAIASGV